MANISGATNANPGTYSTTSTLSSGVAVPGGSRVVAMIGQGSTNEVLVSQAQGSGKDGLNTTYTSNVGADGRHFALANYPLIQNRTSVYKNGIPLNVLELGPIVTATVIPSAYDCQLDITTGHMLLQSAALQDQGGTSGSPVYYVPLSTNTGTGSLVGLTLLDNTAPPETWTIRCISVQRTALSLPILGTAKFLAFGSVSGAQVDANGNAIVWQDNGGTTLGNGILSFSITSSVAFVPGDGFTVVVNSGVLVRGDSLTTNEIPASNINAPTQTYGMSDVIGFCGSPSLTNNLSLGAQLCYANQASSMIAVQAAPALPRRTPYIMANSVNAASLNPDDFIFPFPLGVAPDPNAEIHFFVTDPLTGVETQLLPNKHAFYDTDLCDPATLADGYKWPPALVSFILSNALPTNGGFEYCYTMVQGYDTVVSGEAGKINRYNLSLSQNQVATFDGGMAFNSTYAGKLLKVIDATNSANIGVFDIKSVSDGLLFIETIKTGEIGEPDPLNTINGFPNFTSVASNCAFEIIDVLHGGIGVDGYTDGVLVPTTVGADIATATLYSTSIDFKTFDATIATDGYYRIQLNNTATTDGIHTNQGLYDIIDVSSDGYTVTLQMAFVNESALRYEILDPTTSSKYLVVNKAIVPAGNQLRVTIVDSRDASFYDAGWIKALESLETVECDIVVPLPDQTISVIFQNALGHCIAMSNVLNRKERVLFCGAISGLTTANVTGTKNAAVEDLGALEGIPDNDITGTLAANTIQDIANYSVDNSFGETYRCVYFYPDQIFVQAGSDIVMVDGFYIAAAAAGYANADLRLENPFTNKVFSGFTIMQNKTYSNLILQQLSSVGVTTLQPVAGGGRVVWGLTTTQSGYPEEQEISIVFIRDRVAKVLRSAFKGFIGTPQSADTQATMATEASITLNSLISQGLIQAYTGLTVAQDQTDPRQWDVSVTIQPTYPINWVYIKITVTNLGA